MSRRISAIVFGSVLACFCAFANSSTEWSGISPAASYSYSGTGSHSTAVRTPIAAPLERLTPRISKVAETIRPHSSGSLTPIPVPETWNVGSTMAFAIFALGFFGLATRFGFLKSAAR